MSIYLLKLRENLYQCLNEYSVKSLKNFAIKNYKVSHPVKPQIYLHNHT